MNLMLRKVLLEVISGESQHTSVERLFSLCKSLASRFLSGRYTSIRSIPGSSKQIDDLAADFVADIFQRDENGYYPLLTRYFSGIDLHEASEEIVLSELRRLVVSKVRDNLYRYQKSNDPGLHKIIRGLKQVCAGAHRLDGLRLINGFVEIDDEFDQNKPEISDDLLEIRLGSILKRHQSIRKIVQELMQTLNRQDDHVPRIELVRLAMAIRNAESSLEVSTVDFPEEQLLPNPDELAVFAVNAGQKVMDKLGIPAVLQNPVSFNTLNGGGETPDNQDSDNSIENLALEKPLHVQNRSFLGNGIQNTTTDDKAFNRSIGNHQKTENPWSKLPANDYKIPDCLLIHASVEAILEEYCGEFTRHRTHFEIISGLIPGLDYAIWRSVHRKRFEYLLKLTRSHFLSAIKKELGVR